MNKKIAIIGMGHMGKALYEGLILSGLKKENIHISNNSVDNKKVANDADFILLAVKPAVVSQVITEIKDCLSNKIILSVAAGITIGGIEKYAGNTEQKIIRLMPNLPVAYGKGVIGFYNNNAVSETEKNEVMQVVSGLGTVVDCEKEEDLDVITILSGSGPAVVAYCLSLFEKVGQSFGLAESPARKIAQQTFVGTLELLKQTKKTAQELQDAVATKGGVTEQIINSLDEEQIPFKFQKSFEAGYARIKKLRESFEELRT